MFTKTVVLAVTLASAFSVATAAAANPVYTGSAMLGFYQVTACDCPPWNGPFAAAMPIELTYGFVCCNDQITVTMGGVSTTAVFSGYFDGGEGTQNIALSPVAFTSISGTPQAVEMDDATWSFI
ncbi:unnamed protein product [Mycena citricolor]|uniref:Uncharacterized protein n=1 Tax=Mycena citricolor TaxID=2018698 RepID=A0AAD2H1P9_9AGAR|nr:unnamed protein product [Mycena citricolor]